MLKILTIPLHGIGKHKLKSFGRKILEVLHGGQPAAGAGAVPLFSKWMETVTWLLQTTAAASQTGIIERVDP